MMQTQLVKKTAIIDSGDFNLSAARYLEKVEINSEFDIVLLSDLITFLPKSKRKSGDGQENGNYNFFVSSQTKIKKFDTFDYSEESIILGTGGQASIHIDKEFCTSADTFIFKSKDQSVLTNKFIYHILRGNINILEQGFRGGGLKHLSKDYVKNINIPLPPLEIQEQIVKEIEGYQQIIDGCRQVVENYKPVIDIDLSWDMAELGQVYESNFDAKRIPITKSDRKKGDIPYYGATGIVDYVRDFIFDEELLLVSEDGANLKDRNYPIAFSISGKSWVNNHAHVLKFRRYENQKFIEFYLNNISLEPYITGSAQPKVNQRALNSIKVPNPSMEIQKEIVEKLEQEREVIEGNRELIKIYENKINARINKVWSDN